MTDHKNIKDGGTETPEASTSSNHTAQVTTETKTADKPSIPPNADDTRKKETKGKKGGQSLAVTAIILVLAMGGGLYYHGHQKALETTQAMAGLTEQVNELQQQMNANAARTQQTLAQTAQQQRHQQTLIEQQAQTITSLQIALADMKGRRPNDWLLAEADYLVKQAGRKLWLEHDVMSATALMQTADHRIAELNDPSLVPVRKALAQDITALKAVKRIDRDGIVLRLSSLQKQVSALPLSNAILPKAEEAAVASVSSSVNDWQDNLKASLNDFVGQFVTYRKRDGRVIPLLTPTQTFRLQENVKAKLDQAITAVYREQGRLYHESLSMAQAWTKRFYNPDAAVTQSFLAELEQLHRQTIQVSYPDNLTSQSLINDLVADRLQRNLAPVETGDSTQ